MELKKINLPQMWMYQDMGEQLFSFFKTNNVERENVVKGITLNKNAFTYCINGESCTPKDLPNIVLTVTELEQGLKSEIASLQKSAKVKSKKVFEEYLSKLDEKCFNSDKMTFMFCDEYEEMTFLMMTVTL
ncbi:hypothetical protein DAPPUDRAFT_328077 [Daphnia pulex]|uniref:Uncharacterized protein n=1 Tax=Daphnia pulex TaxID=6669 RepID=E9HCG1_DAPPU|nr:hypothetical protein DAPPUDRAFT_328077 [Daphnia pulex]|eukprot:EFX70539.1 hypothetical protein DAPPUDRAFT_328077 [Daphnia pulex]